MVSLYWLFTVFFLVCCSTTTFARDDLTSRRENNSTNITVSYLNATTNTTTCNLLMDKSKISEVLSKHDDTNTVKMKISVVPGNKTRYFQELEMAWASEVGRTIISLIKRVKGTIFTSPLFTAILEVGTEDVDIQLKEETDGCLPSGERGSEHIFNFLLRQLSHRDDAHVFKLCQAHTDETTGYTTYYCCRMVGDENLVICADYVSIVVKWALPVVAFTFCISCLMVVPFVLQYIMTYPETEFYKMSSSPMSLVSIASVILFEGHGVYRSFFRRCVFAGFSYLVVFSPNFFGWEWLRWLFVVWVVLFVFSQKYMPLTHEEYTTSDERPEQTGTDTNHTSCCCTDSSCKKMCTEKCSTTLQWDVKLISCFTDPARWLIKVTEWCKKTCCSTNGNEECCETLAFVYSPIVCLCGIPFYLIGYCLFAAFCLTNFFLFELSLFFIWPNHRCDGGKKTGQKMFLVLLRLPTLVIIMIFTGMIFISVLYLVASITLNAEYFNPFIAPFFTLMGYFWKNWKSSVEAKCLELKTLIIEVSAEENPQENRQNLVVNYTSADATNRNESMGTLTGPIEDTSENNSIANDYENIIKKDEVTGEAMIPKELYKTISKKFLRMDHLLFYFFRRVLFVGLYAFGMLTVMILGRDSGVSGIVQIVGAILAGLIPFVFDTIFAEQHLSQRTCKNAANRQKLEHILKVCKENSGDEAIEVYTLLKPAFKLMHTYHGK